MSDGPLNVDRSIPRKRPLGSRLLSTRTSARGGGGGDINNGGGSSAGSPCWKCKSIVDPREYFCECGAAQLLDGRLDYFEMFDCPPSVFLELKEVETRFKNMQRAFHPDLFASKCEDEQEISAANSAAVNKAYQTLVEPMSRVRYLMRLLGSTALEEEGADDRTPVPMDFLMEVMATRESLERSSSEGEVEAISAETTTAINECLQDMDEALKAGGGKDELSDAAVRLRYLYRIQKEAQRVLHGLEDGRASPDAGSA
eukprot:g2896.t1